MKGSWLVGFSLGLVGVACADAPSRPTGSVEKRVVAPYLEIEQNAQGYLVRFQAPEIHWSEIFEPKAHDQKFLDLRAEGCGETDEVGLPRLPVLRFDLILGAGEAAALEVLESRDEAIALPAKVYPQQMPWPLSKAFEQRPFRMDRGYYLTHGEPLAVAAISDRYRMHGARGISVTLRPFSYDPLEDTLTARSGELQILAPPVGTLEVDSPAFSSVFQAVFANYPQDAQVSRTERYLIIAPPQFLSRLEPLVKHREKDGYLVEAFSTGETGTTREQILAFLQGRYDKQDTRPAFVLLVGDTNLVATWRVYSQYVDGTVIPTDHVYALLEGADADPDLFVGRFPVRTEAELDRAIHKTIAFETQLAGVPRTATLAGGPDAMFHDSIGSMAPLLETAGYNAQRYECQNGVTNVQAQITASIESGLRFASFFAHGWPTGMPDCVTYEIPQVRKLTNAVFPLVTTHSCSTCPYDQPEAFCEAWIRHDKGAAAVTGSSVTAWYPHEKYMGVGLLKARFENGLKRLGPMLLYAKKLNDQMTDNALETDYYYQINLMGDAALYTEDP